MDHEKAICEIETKFLKCLQLKNSKMELHANMQARAEEKMKKPSVGKEVSSKFKNVLSVFYSTWAHIWQNLMCLEVFRSGKHISD